MKGLLYPEVTDLWEVAQRSVRNWGGRGKNPLSSSCSLGWKNRTEKKSAGWYKEKQGMTGRKEEAPTWRETMVKEEAPTGRETLVKGGDSELAPVGSGSNLSYALCALPAGSQDVGQEQTLPRVIQQLQGGCGEWLPAYAE